MGLTTGNPGACANFNRTPVVTNYSQALESDSLDGMNQQCGLIWLDFDYKLSTANPTGNEYLTVELLYDTTVVTCAEYRNNASTGWLSQHINIYSVKGKIFKFRFRAHGVNSADVFQWSIDNIHIYGTCLGPRNLEGIDFYSGCPSGGFLRWSLPRPAALPTGIALWETFESGIFPPQNFTQLITDTTASNTTWSQGNASSGTGVHSGLGSAAVNWDYKHQDEWLIAHNILITGNLTFWSYAFQGSTYLDHYYVKISFNQGATWIILSDLSAMSAYPSSDGWNKWNTPYEVDLSNYLGTAVDIAWQAVDGDGQGLWYSWAIDDCVVGSKKLDIRNFDHLSVLDNLLGYDIYQKAYFQPAFVKINTAIVTDTFYCITGIYELKQYYVKAVYDSLSCYGSCSSDTVMFAGGWGIIENSSNQISVYPNPANDALSVESDYDISRVEMVNTYGQTVYKANGSCGKTLNIDIGKFPPGIYFLDLTTDKGLRKVKVVISRR